MKSISRQRQPGHPHAEAKAGRVPLAFPPLAAREKHYLIWGILRLGLGVMQMAFAATAIVCLVCVGLSSATIICIAIATAATLVSRVLFHGKRGVRL